MAERVNRVEAIRGTSKVSPVRPFGFLDSETKQSQPQKKQMNHPHHEENSKDNGCHVNESGTHIDCNI